MTLEVTGQNHFIKRYNSSLTGQYSAGNSLVVTPGNGYAMNMNTSNGGFLITTDSSGNVKTCRHYSINDYYYYSELEDIVCTNDSNLLVVGHFEQVLNQTIVGLVKLNVEGDVLWSQRVGNSFGDSFLAKHASGELCLLTGNQSSYGLILSNLNASGNIINSYRFADSLGQTFYMDRFIPVDNNRVLVSGRVNSIAGVIMADSSGGVVFFGKLPRLF